MVLHYPLSTLRFPLLVFSFSMRRLKIESALQNSASLPIRKFLALSCGSTCLPAGRHYPLSTLRFPLLVFSFSYIYLISYLFYLIFPPCVVSSFLPVFNPAIVVTAPKATSAISIPAIAPVIIFFAFPVISSLPKEATYIYPP